MLLQTGGSMTLESLSSLVALLLAISLAAERLVTIVKTAIPRLNEPAKNPATGEEDSRRDKWRRLAVQALALIAAWITSALLGSADNQTLGQFFFSNKIPYADGKSLPVWLVAFLGSGGSAFWTQILGYTKAVREVKQQNAAEATATRTLASAQGVAVSRATQLQDPAVRQREQEALAKVKAAVAGKRGLP